jgi:predicted HD phosphohydrolase
VQFRRFNAFFVHRTVPLNRGSDRFGIDLTVPFARFAAEPFAEAAVRLRRWDDLAKRTDLATPDFAHYRPMIEAVIKG